MPRNKIDYSKTIIYKIVCNDLLITDIYVGSTTNFTRRKSQHKHNCNKPKSRDYNFKIYQIIRDCGNWENWTMIQIEEYPCSNSNEATARERYWYEQLQATLNVRHPQRTDQEYYGANKEHIAEYKKQYAEINKDKISEKGKKYYLANKEHISEYKKQYAQKNKDKLAEYKKKWYESNKNKMVEKLESSNA
jgi:hypothetical protein